MTDNFWNDAPLIASYSWQQGGEDRILMRMEPWIDGVRPGWADAPLIMTTNCFAKVHEIVAVHEADQDRRITLLRTLINSVWCEFIGWRDYVYATLPEEDRMFVCERHGTTFWVI